MKKSILAISILSLTSGVALADDFTIGYAKNDVSIGNFSTELTGISGTYTFDLPDNKNLSFIVTSSYTSNEYKASYSMFYDEYLTSIEVTSFTASFGPQFNLNEYVSVYAVAGMDFMEMTGKTISSNVNNQYGSDSDVALNYGFGLKVHPVKPVSLSMGFEFSSPEFSGMEFDSSKFMIGGGINF